MYVVVPKATHRLGRSILGMYDNHDGEGNRLYGLNYGTVFNTRKDAIEASKKWQDARVLRVLIVEQPLPFGK